MIGVVWLFIVGVLRSLLSSPAGFVDASWLRPRKHPEAWNLPMAGSMFSTHSAKGHPLLRCTIEHAHLAINPPCFGVGEIGGPADHRLRGLGSISHQQRLAGLSRRQRAQPLLTASADQPEQCRPTESR